LVILFAAILFEALLALAAAALGGGTPSYGRSLAAFFSISVWTIGLYYLTLSFITRLAFNDNPDVENLDALVPSMLTLMSHVSSTFLRGVLAALNPFTLAAVWLHAQALLYVVNMKTRPAYIAAIFLGLIEVLASGVLVSTLG
jgi:hypothetical protein